MLVIYCGIKILKFFEKNKRTERLIIGFLNGLEESSSNKLKRDLKYIIKIAVAGVIAATIFFIIAIYILLSFLRIL